MIEVLKTERLVLHPLAETHAAGLFEALSDPLIYRFIPQSPPGSVESLGKRFAFLECRASPDGKELWLNWAVEEKESGRLVGQVEVTLRAEGGGRMADGGVALLAFLFSPTVWGKGYAAEASRRVIDALVRDFDVRTIEATADVRNERSRHLLERLGFAIVEERDSEDLIDGLRSREVLYRRR